MKIVKTILFSLFGLMLINSGLNKFLNYLPVPEGLPEELMKDSTAMMEVSWLMPLVGLAELVAGLLILTHLTVAQDGIPMALVIWAILIWIIYDNRHKYLPMVR